MSGADLQTKDPYIVKNTPLNYNANDWFYMNPVNCVLQTDGSYKDLTGKDSTQCAANKAKVANLTMMTNELDASRTQYNDSKLLYNRELLFTINMLAGLALLCYYIYLNQSAIPGPSKLMEGAKKMSGPLSSVASLAVNNLSMRPPPPAAAK
jgi:hypothetical protein